MGNQPGAPGDLIRGWAARDWMVVGGGLAVLVFSLFDDVSVSAGVFSTSVSAWHGYSALGVVVLLALAVVWALRAMQVLTATAGARVWGLGAAAAGAVGTAAVVAWAEHDASSAPAAFGLGGPPGVHAGLGVGGLAVAAAGVLMTAGALWAALVGDRVIVSLRTPGERGGARRPSPRHALGTGRPGPAADAPGWDAGSARHAGRR